MNDVALRVDDLRISTTAGIEIVSGISFEVRRGGSLGLVGESGSGKTLTGLAVLDGLPDGVEVTGGTISMPGSERPSGRRRRPVSMVFQNPMNSLNPLMRVGPQIAEAFRINHGMSRRAAAKAAIEALERVDIPDPELRARQWPHQLSGGQRQRAMIAVALACRAEILIADEPTTALDVSVQSAIVKLLLRLRQEGLTIIFISHDLPLVANVCERLCVLYAGQVVEQGPVADLVRSPRHPYLSALLECVPKPGVALTPITGGVPDPGTMDDGCRFRDRCKHAADGCELPQAIEEEPGGYRLVRCHRAPELTLVGIPSAPRVPTGSTQWVRS